MVRKEDSLKANLSEKNALFIWKIGHFVVQFVLLSTLKSNSNELHNCNCMIVLLLHNKCLAVENLDSFAISFQYFKLLCVLPNHFEETLFFFVI